MLRNYLTTARRNLARNKLYAAINIAGLAVGFAAALLIALFVREEFSYDTWIPGHRNVFLLTQTLGLPGQTPVEFGGAEIEWADALKLDFPSIQAITRMSAQEISLRHGDVEANETIYWADPNLFDVLPFPVIAGDPKGALNEPDGIVLTRRMARKYFGRDAPIGEMLEINRQNPMRVTAVIEDLPPNTHLTTEIIGSGRAAFSFLAQRKANPPPALSVGFDGWLYLRLAPGASAAEIERQLPSFLDRRMKPSLAPFSIAALRMTPLSNVHLHPGALPTVMKPPQDPSAVVALAGIGLLIVVVASINFVNLMTARAAHRAVEIGVRKTMGATRPNLIVQFLGEALIYTALAAAFAVAAGALLLPSVKPFLDWNIPFDFGDGLAAEISGAIIAVGVLAGAYPAFVLSSFRPAAALKGAVVRVSGSGRLRQGLVVFQFATLISLMVGTGIIYSQTVFALNRGLQFDKDQFLLVQTGCANAFPERVRALPGVHGAACSAQDGLVATMFAGIKRDGQDGISFERYPVDEGYLDLYGIRPLAGRLFSRDRAADAPPADATQPRIASVVINETAARRLGFSSPDAAIGQALTDLNGPPTTAPSSTSTALEVVGVVPDFSFDSIHNLIGPSAYVVPPRGEYSWLSIKLTGKNVPETLRAIDAVWKETGDPRPIKRHFLDQDIQKLYLDITRQSQLLGIFAGVAIFIACLGLLGLASFTAESRTKEIGIRKAMGASRADILRMLLWQFAKPVLWANLIAWPVAGYLMNRWLHGFAYHVDLEPWIFVGASAVALVIALATVAGHAFLVARAKPVTALRYE